MYYTLLFFSILMIGNAAIFGGFTVNIFGTTAVCAALGFVMGLIKCAALSKTTRLNKFSEKSWSDHRFHVSVEWDA